MRGKVGKGFNKWEKVKVEDAVDELFAKIEKELNLSDFSILFACKLI